MIRFMQLEKTVPDGTVFFLRVSCLFPRGIMKMGIQNSSEMLHTNCLSGGNAKYMPYKSARKSSGASCFDLFHLISVASSRSTACFVFSLLAF